MVEENNPKIEWVVLTNVLNDIEFGIIKGLLEIAGIPAVRRVEGIQQLIGAQLGGIDILVPSDRLGEAKQLLEAGFTEDAPEETD